MFKLSAIFLFLMFAVTLEYELKCPDSGEWRLRAVGVNCSIISQYVCLFRYPERAYHETCDGLDYSSTGSKLIYEPFFNKAYCSYERYQPFPFSTDGSSKCLYQKSFCSEKGQYVFQKGSIISDISCGCDLTRGYEFVNMPKHECYCIPSEEDCSCHKIPCNDLVDQCPKDADEITTKSMSTTLKENRFSDAINVFDHDNNGKNYRFQCLYITLVLSAVMIIIVILFYALFKHLQGYFIYEPSSEIHIDEGQPLELMYKLLINSPSYFLINNKRLPKKENIETFKKGLFRYLQFSKVTLENIGFYCLKVEGHRSRRTKITVQPIIERGLEDKTVMEGSELKLECVTVKNNCRVQWFKDDVEIEIQPDRMEIEESTTRIHTLCISKTSAEDIGTYCIKIGVAESIAKLDVKAIFKRRLKDMTLMEGSELKLECETVEDNCRVQWFKNDVEIKIPPDGMKIEESNTRIHTLCISKTSSEDIGTYSIKIEGAESIAKLDIKEMPETIKLMSTNLRNAFLKAAAESGITKRQTIKVMIVGSASAGKTCLFKRLMNEEIDNVKSTDGINIERRTCQIDIQTGEWHFCKEPKESTDHTENFAVCEFWDFAGPRDFYATHQNFLCTNAVYLLVVDIAKDFETKRYYDMIEEEEFDRIEEYIAFWLDNIHCYSREDSNELMHYNGNNWLNPPVIIVGTGIDKIVEFQVEERKNDFERYLRESLSGHSKVRHLRKPHFISNTRPSNDKQEFKSLRNDIFRHALTTCSYNLPTRWIDLEKAINSKLSEHVTSYSDVKQLAKQRSFHENNQMNLELKSFLKFEHDIRNIITFEDVEGLIILDLKWLMDIFRCFVSQPYTYENFCMPEWCELEQTGKLSDELIEKLLGKVPDLSTPERKKIVLRIMEKFDIIVRPINDANKNDLYMPCMRGEKVPLDTIVRSLKSESKQIRKTSWFCLTFDFLPPSFYNHILSSFVKRNKLLFGTDKRLCIHRNIGGFQLNTSGCQTLVICLSKNAIDMQVRHLNSNENICFSEIKDQLIDSVNSIKQRYGINIKYTIKFKCSDGIHKSKKIDLMTGLETSEYYCKDHRGVHSSKEIYSSWFTQEEFDKRNSLYSLDKLKSNRFCQECRRAY